MLLAQRETRAAMQAAVAEFETRLGSHAIDDMAVPSYLRRGLVSRLVFWRKLHQIVRVAALRPSTRVFDFGCGTGVLLPTLTADGRNVQATDLRLDLARRLVERMNLPRVEFLAADAWEPAVLDNEIETIIAANVLEHIEDRQSLLRVFARKLTPTGRLVISGPTENLLYRTGRKLIGFTGEYHVTTIREILADADAVGLKRRQLVRWPLPGAGCLYQIAAFGRD